MFTRALTLVWFQLLLLLSQNKQIHFSSFHFVSVFYILSHSQMFWITVRLLSLKHLYISSLTPNMIRFPYPTYTNWFIPVPCPKINKWKIWGYQSSHASNTLFFYIQTHLRWIFKFFIFRGRKSQWLAIYCLFTSYQDKKQIILTYNNIEINDRVDPSPLSNSEIGECR